MACRHADAINGWLSRLGETDDAGRKITLDLIATQVFPVFAGGEKISTTALKRHRRSHTIRVEDGEKSEAEEAVAARQESALDLFDRILGEGWRESPPAPDRLLELQRALYVRDLEADVLAGRSIKLSHDQVLKSIAEATRRGADEARNELLRSLTAGIGAAFAGSIDGPEIAGELEASGEVVEGEIVEESDE